MASHVALILVTLTIATALMGQTFMRTSSNEGLTPSMYECDNNIDPTWGGSSEGVTLTLDGNPSYYQPLAIYHASLFASQSLNRIEVSAMMTSQSKRTNCFLLHNLLSPFPLNHLSFYWMAPPSGTGCLYIRIRASTMSGLIYNDVFVHHICEKDSVQSGDHVTSGLLFKEDFDLSSLDSLWSSNRAGVVVDSNCSIFHGNAAVFCNMTSKSRNLITKAINATNAKTLEFVLGAGSCSSNRSRVQIHYGDATMTQEWTLLRSIRVPTASSNRVVITDLPVAAKKEQLRLRFSESLPSWGAYGGCWGVDEVLVTINHQLPTHIADDMGPFRPDNVIPLQMSITSECGGSALTKMIARGAQRPSRVTTREINLSGEAPTAEVVETLMVTGSIAAQGACGHDPDQIVNIFNQPGTRSVCTDTSMDLSGKAAAAFTLSMGGANCSSTKSHKGDVQMYYVKEKKELVFHTFHYEDYSAPREVHVAIPEHARSRGVILCLRQKFQIRTTNVWALDSFRLLPEAEVSHCYVQFSINLACNLTANSATIKLEYSTDSGRKWTLIRSACFSNKCLEKDWGPDSVYDVDDVGHGWHRVTLPVPVVALSSATQFRWKEVASNVTSEWGIDDIYIGSDEKCPNMCNGKGSCSVNGCRCDPGFSGSTCNITSDRLLDFLSDNFNSGSVGTGLFEKVSGCKVGFQCGIVGSGKALVCGGAGRRELTTRRLNATGLRFVQFAIVLGKYPSTGFCKPSNISQDGVLVQYSTNNNQWKFLKYLDFSSSHQPKVVSLPLPSDAMAEGLQVRWLQPRRSNDAGVWALDDVLVTSALFRTASSRSVNFHLGSFRSYCGRDMILTFIEGKTPQTQRLRYAETQSLEVTKGYVVQIEVVIGCREMGNSSSQHDEHDAMIEFQYSTNHGRSWDRIFEVTLPHPSPISAPYHPATLYHASKFNQWRRVNIPLPRHTWSEGTRFRMAQYTLGGRWDSWAVDKAYMGPECPLHCRGNGECWNGECRCDDGYHGNTCLPDYILPSGLDAKFDEIGAMMKSGWRIAGGCSSLEEESTCGTMTSSTYVHFSKNTVRELVTPPLNLTNGGHVQLYLKIGGKSCGKPQNRSNSVFLQFSVDGEATWRHIQEFHFSDYPRSTYINLPIPAAAHQPYVMLRWWQPANWGTNADQWSIDDVIIGKPASRDAIRYNSPVVARDVEAQETSSKSIKDNVIITSSDLGKPEEFCSPREGGIAFNRTMGARFAITDDYDLNEEDTLQFEINIACSTDFSPISPIRLQFSHNRGYHWEHVRHACYLDGIESTRNDATLHESVTSLYCAGFSSELTEATIYHEGDYDVWTRVVIPITSPVAGKRVRFQWIQEGDLQADWMLANIYIGPSCPRYCSGHGSCHAAEEGPRCRCDRGYVEADDFSCVPGEMNPRGFWDKFDAPQHWWKRPLGGNISMLPGNSALCFNESGTRRAETKNLDTSNLRLVQFDLHMGGPNETSGSSVIFQFSINNGISWNLIEVMKLPTVPGSKHSRFNFNIPLKAKTTATLFRWWQPLTDVKEKRWWCIDDVIVGRSDITTSTLYDNFDASRGATRLNEDRWYKLKEGRVGEFAGIGSSTKGLSLVFDSQSGEQYVESWELFVLPGSFVQFDIIMGSSKNSDEAVKLEYSEDLGRNWSPVSPFLLPGTNASSAIDFGSLYPSSLNSNWTRHNILISDVIRFRSVRFRWMQHLHNDSRWALDNIYIGNQCEWMCGGFGRCEPASNSSGYVCSCDQGFETPPHCESSTLKMSSMTEDFDQPRELEGKFALLVGGQTDFTPSRVMVWKHHLRFARSGVRMLQTFPINTNDVRYLQFHLRFDDVTNSSASSSIVVQSSLNNGITWDTLQWISSSNGGVTQFLHILLPLRGKRSTTVFRWWQPLAYTEENASAWSLDNVAIGGRWNGCDRHVFDGEWLFHSGEVRSYCVGGQRGNRSLGHNSNNALVIPLLIGQRMLMTHDLCIVRHDYVIQFKMTVGCGDVIATSEHGVSLEFSLDDGITWNLVMPHCHGNNHKECGVERHPASVYYPGAWIGWRRVVIPLRGKSHICDRGPMRFRWNQGWYRSADEGVVWAIDDVYIGPGCGQMCNGHGYCDDGVCICDVEYGGENCCDVINSTNPQIFEETFDDALLDSLWLQTSGGETTSSLCPNQLFTRHHFVMNKPGTRMLMTRDIDASRASFLQFHIQQENTGNDVTDPTNDITIYVQYSTSGGLLWGLLASLILPENQTRFISFYLGEESRHNSTRFRWWEPSTSGRFARNWSLHHVVIGRDYDKLEDDFSSSKEGAWVELASSGPMTHSGGKCCSGIGECAALIIGGTERSRRDCGHRWAATTGVSTGPGSYIHFYAQADCGSNSSDCHELSLEYSTDLGQHWSLLRRASRERCSVAEEETKYSSDQFVGGRRIVVPIPEWAWSPSTRFRWRMSNDIITGSWIIDDVYIGRECPMGCSAHGACRSGACECDHDWVGAACQAPSNPLPNELKDNYEGNSTDLYSMVIGGKVDDACGEVGFGGALHFNQGCSRVLVTRGLDTREAEFLQFMFRFACDEPTNHNQIVLVDYTRNGGITWNILVKLRHETGEGARFINLLLPTSARGDGVNFRWWQPAHGGVGKDDWGIDNLAIGGKHIKTKMSDNFSLNLEDTSHPFFLDRDDVKTWLFYDNTKLASFCNRDHVIYAPEQPSSQVSITTKDLVVGQDFIFQYEIAVLCEDMQRSHQPVHVQYSTDYGETWGYVTPQCLPFDKECFGKETSQPTAHFIGPGWRRRTVEVQDELLGRSVRFRWIQFHSDAVWGLDRVYIGTRCISGCSGHGACVADVTSQRCYCDDGYGGNGCHENEERKNYLKATFNDLTSSQWKWVEGEKYSTDCGLLMDGVAIKFDGVGPRQAETEELDLRDARFVQFYVVIGSTSHPTSCRPANQRSEGILLQYSVDGGMSWTLLRELDYSSYPTPTHDYIMLPLAARTSTTSLRWWQPFSINESTGLVTMGESRAGWAIDDVYIGGHEVNAPLVEENFDSIFTREGALAPIFEEKFDFFPNGVIGRHFCGGATESMLITWSGGDVLSREQSITTRHMIVSHNFMIQFKIRVGCSTTDDVCSREFGVRLEYRTSALNDWSLVRDDCFVDAPLTQSCFPLRHHQATVFYRHGNWSRVTIPLDFIDSETAQFRWWQDGGSPAVSSWALDDIYIGEACPEYCSGRGRCTEGPRCICDQGYMGPNCANPSSPLLIPDFMDDFEAHSSLERAMMDQALRIKRKKQEKWDSLKGGEVSYGGCGGLRPFGFGRTVYFNSCGPRWLQTVEMDLRKGSFVQYVIQIGMFPPRTGCHVNTSRGAGVLLEYTVNNGVTWNMLKEHRHFGKPLRILIKFSEEIKTAHTILRWWQPRHHGAGEDQWALDNIEIITSRINRHVTNLRGPPLTSSGQDGSFTSG